MAKEANRKASSSAKKVAATNGVVPAATGATPAVPTVSVAKPATAPVADITAGVGRLGVDGTVTEDGPGGLKATPARLVASTSGGASPASPAVSTASTDSDDAVPAQKLPGPTEEAAAIAKAKLAAQEEANKTADLAKKGAEEDDGGFAAALERQRQRQLEADTLVCSLENKEACLMCSG